MWNSKVIWSEGMFLQPQHLQQHDRYVESLIERRTAALEGHAWGCVALAIDEAPLRLGKIALAGARGLLPDGTPFDFPAEEDLPLALDIPADARNERVVLALPLRRPFGLDTDRARLVRLFFQPVLVLWALWAGGLLGRRRPAPTEQQQREEVETGE